MRSQTRKALKWIHDHGSISAVVPMVMVQTLVAEIYTMEVEARRLRKEAKERRP